MKKEEWAKVIVEKSDEAFEKYKTQSGHLTSTSERDFFEGYRMAVHAAARGELPVLRTLH